MNVEQLPQPSSFILDQLVQFSLSFFNKTPAYLFHIRHINTNQLSSILAVKATKRTLCFLPQIQKGKENKVNRALRMTCHLQVQLENQMSSIDKIAGR